MPEREYGEVVHDFLNGQELEAATHVAITRELGMRPIMERVLSRREILRA